MFWVVELDVIFFDVFVGVFFVVIFVPSPEPRLG